jgi:hypothetical protein
VYVRRDKKKARSRSGKVTETTYRRFVRLEEMLKLSARKQRREAAPAP